MKQHIERYVTILLLAMLTLTGCQPSKRTTPTAAVTTDIEAQATELYEKEPERALSMVDAALSAGTMADFRASLLKAKLFSMSVNNQRQDDAQRICEQLLRHDSVKANPTLQQEVLVVLVNASRMRHDDEQWLRWAMQLSEQYHQHGNESDALRTKAEIGLVMTHLGQVSDGMAKIDEAIRQLDEMSDSFDGLIDYVLASKRKITVYRETERYADILPVAQNIIDHLGKSEDTRSTHADHYDFYYAQATAFKAIAYAKLGNRVDARRELEIFAKTDYGHSLDGRKMIAPTLGELGDHATMLAIYDDAEQELRGDTLRYDYAEILLARAQAAEAQGHLVASLGYRKRYESLLQTLNDRLHRNQTHDYAARYHAQEQQMEIERQQAEIMRMNILILMGIIILLLAIAFAVYFFRQKRIVDHKNHVLVEQISDAIKYKKRYEEAKKGAKEEDHTVIAPPVTKSPDLNTMTDEQLFDYMSDIILREQLYLNPVCDRQMIVERFGLSEKRVDAAFSKGSVYKSVASFIRDSRLEYACQLLRQNPEMSIGSVATASGFSNHTRFTADFKTRYSVSPTEFRTLSM